MVLLGRLLHYYQISLAMPPSASSIRRLLEDLSRHPAYIALIISQIHSQLKELMDSLECFEDVGLSPFSISDCRTWRCFPCSTPWPFLEHFGHHRIVVLRFQELYSFQHSPFVSCSRVLICSLLAHEDRCLNGVMI